MIQQDIIMYPKCMHCGCDDKSMLEINVVGNLRTIVCNVCSKTTQQLCEPKS